MSGTLQGARREVCAGRAWQGEFETHEEGQAQSPGEGHTYIHTYMHACMHA